MCIGGMRVALSGLVAAVPPPKSHTDFQDTGPRRSASAQGRVGFTLHSPDALQASKQARERERERGTEVGRGETPMQRQRTAYFLWVGYIAIGVV